MIPYKPSPTLHDFHMDDRFVRGVMGPFGSGKSCGMCQEIYLRCLSMRAREDGVKRSRWAIVRNTKEQLRDTTLRTWLDWFPDGIMGHWASTDMTYHLKYRDEIYGSVEAEILFRALDKPDDVKKLLSLELTGGFVNEAREVPWAIIDGLTGRVGRYPRYRDFMHVKPDNVVEEFNEDGEETGLWLFPDGSEWDPYWSGIIMDTNPPDEDHWWYNKFEVQAYEDEQVGELYKVFKQPPAVLRVDKRWKTNPRAENLKNLKPHYYENMVVGKDPEWIKVYAEGKYGVVSDGRPVYAGYNDELHCKEFDIDPRLDVYIGWDYSFLGQACVLAQCSPRGQLRIFREFVGEDTGIGLHDFVLNAVKPGLADIEVGLPPIRGVPSHITYAASTGDPAGAKRGDLDEKFALEMLNDGYQDMQCKLPFETYPADTNALSPRLEGVNHYLNRMIDGAPAFLLHPRCKTLRKGFMGRYEFGRVQVVGEERYKDQPKKNKFSHPQDALQYLCRGILCDVQEEQQTRKQRVGESYYSG